MFTFNHVTSIGIDEAEYARRLAAGETNLVKGENKFYREIATEVTVPTSYVEFIKYLDDGKESTDEIKLGDEKFTVPVAIKHFLVGLKLSINQEVQAANRDGNGGPSNLEIVQSVLRNAKQGSDEFLQAAGA